MKVKTKKYLISMLEGRKKSLQGMIDNRLKHDKLMETNLRIDPDLYEKTHNDTYEDYLKWSANTKNNLTMKILEIDRMIDEIKKEC
jgi:hypothetical protein